MGLRRASKAEPGCRSYPSEHSVAWPGCATEAIEPALGPVDFTRLQIVAPDPPFGPGAWLNALTGHVVGPDDILPDRVDWIIVGGESGQGSRPMHPQWARSVRDQCQSAGVAFFFKQWGITSRSSRAPAEI